MRAASLNRDQSATSNARAFGKLIVSPLPRCAVTGKLYPQSREVRVAGWIAHFSSESKQPNQAQCRYLHYYVKVSTPRNTRRCQQRK